MIKQEWQPIDTAPKDLELLLLVDKYDECLLSEEF